MLSNERISQLNIRNIKCCVQIWQDPAFDYKIVNKNADNNLAIPGHVLLLFSSIR